ncbi:hypothetical protein CLIB1444_01S13476 [[Candida] jaroonii]|uniref:Uncharacterized protein n=1 Tax=[Candida] jaroonii TaxID=467808 RepID=A0ACA9Y1B6_9ASCO|nr:hypothetical protein CLIB1444_01S13476 [[Candida] jaroonii]
MSDSEKKKKFKGLTNTKTIKPTVNGSVRVAQACDRCRAKKTKCDGKQPSCSGCEAIGIKCIVSDKLTRRAFPKGYTEILEERIRQLEGENSRLSDLVNLRDEQINNFQSLSPDNTRGSDDNKPGKSFDLNGFNNGTIDFEETTTHTHDQCCGCGDNNFHQRPVSVNELNDGNHGPLSINNLDLSDEDDETNSLLSTDDELISNSLGSILIKRNTLYSNKFNNDSSKPAPGAFAAATAIEKMQKGSKMIDQQSMLTALVAASIPRTTEETLFVPTLLSSVCQNYGYDSKQAILAANAIGSLKDEINNSDEFNNVKLVNLIMEKKQLTDEEKLFFLKNLSLGNSRVEFDQLITMYFKHWGSFLPILNRNSFLKSYSDYLQIIETDKIDTSDSIEKFGATMVLILAMSLLSSKYDYFNMANSAIPNKASFEERLNYYDYLIRQFIKPQCVITKVCSIQSLQILSLALQYFLAIGDVSTCFELRGRVITMAQQLRLHRCPAAVLGFSGIHNKNLRNLQQGERRILFWSVYILDVYSSLNLGVPRLLKDSEIECALPFAGKKVDDDDEENENILIVNNTRLTIVGKVSRYSLSVMLYSRVLSSILDNIYYSSQENDSDFEISQKKETQLEIWRRELPEELKFETGVNRNSLVNEIDKDHWEKYSVQQLSLIFLYFHARTLIYLPIISKFGNHFDIGLSEKTKLTKGMESKSSIISSISMIQQSSLQILQILRTFLNPMNPILLSVPLNLPREHSRLSLLVAKGTLDYIKGGTLYSSSKNLLLDTVPLIVRESNLKIPGSLSKNSSKLIEMAILSILGLPSKTPLLKKKNTVKPVVKRPSMLNNVVYSHDLESSISQTDEIKSEQSTDVSDPTDQEEIDIDTLLEFDPFKVNLSQNALANEFAADGSLGLAPFLNYDEFLNLE